MMRATRRSRGDPWRIRQPVSRPPVYRAGPALPAAMTAVIQAARFGPRVQPGSGLRGQDIRALQARIGNQAVTRFVLAAAVAQRDDGRGPRTEAPQNVPAVPDSGPAADAGLGGVKAKVEQLIQASRQLGYAYAAANLEHWYRGHGERLIMPEAAFTHEAFWLRHLRDTHGARFAQGAQRRAMSGALAPGGSADMTWRDSVVAPADSELFYALGGFTVDSSVTVTASEIPGDPASLLVTVTRWKVRCSDYYNFDPGKTAFIPGFGRIEDAEMDQLRQAGLAHDFPVESVPIDALRALGTFEVSVPRR